LAILNVNSQKTTIKGSFSEAAAVDLLRIAQAGPRHVLQALSDAPPHTFASLKAEEIAAIYPIVSWVDQPQEAAYYLPNGFEVPPLDVAGDTFERLELARKAAEHKAPYMLLPRLARVYFGDSDKRTAAEAYALGAAVLEQLSAFLDRFKDLAADPPSEDEVEAGIEALHSFGPYGIAEGIAARYGCRPLEVFAWSAEEVYMSLLYSQAKSRYQDNLREIERRKSGANK
jgi:hypothetical protein